MPNADKMEYDLRLKLRVKIKKWRIDDPSKLENAEWKLIVFDRNQAKWVHVDQLDRPGEDAYIEAIDILEG